MTKVGDETFYNLCPQEVVLCDSAIDPLTKLPTKKWVLSPAGLDLRLLSAEQTSIPHELGLGKVITPQRFIGLDPKSPGYACLIDHPHASFFMSMPCAEWYMRHFSGPNDTRGIYAPASGPKHAVRDLEKKLIGSLAFEQYRAPVLSQ